MSDAPQALTVTRSNAGGSVVFNVSGTVEFATTDVLRDAIFDGAPADGDPLVLDLSGVEFIDSSGVSLLVQAKHRCDADRRAFVLRQPAARVQRVLEVAGLGDMFDVEP